jgi:hypothetical protein
MFAYWPGAAQCPRHCDAMSALGVGFALAATHCSTPRGPTPPPRSPVWEAEHLAGIEQVKEALSNEAERAKKMR